MQAAFEEGRKRAKPEVFEPVDILIEIKDLEEPEKLRTQFSESEQAITA